MEYLGQIYRKACREIVLPPEQKTLFMRLLREISVNAVRSRKAWHIKEDFMVLWWMSAGKFPAFRDHEFAYIVIDWVSEHLPFELTKADRIQLVS